MKKRRQHSSCSGFIAREILRIAMRTPRLKNGGLFTIGADKSKSVSKWKPPKWCSLEKINHNGPPMEFLTTRSGIEDRAILQLHGGAYLMGYTDIYRRFAYRYARISGGIPVLSVDYRIAPEYQYPCALEDALSAWKWLLEHSFQPNRIIVAGDSAGGNLALAMTIRLREEGRELPNALILMSPWADMTGSGASRSFNFEKDPLFGKCAGDETADEIRAPGNPYAKNIDLHDAHLSPVFASFENFPPMLIQVGDWEMLLSEARTVAQKARAAGVDVTISEYPGMFHVFQICCGLLPESRCAWKEVGTFIEKRFSQ